MPNWVNNFLSIQTKDLDKVVNKKNEVDFNILVPMPKELEHTIAGGNVDKCMEYYRFKQAHPHSVKKLEQMKSEIIHNREDKTDKLHIFNEKTRQYDTVYDTIENVGKFYCELQEKYGVHDWYEWHCQNWGCKWNASDTSINEPYSIDGVEFVDIQFSTPWGPPAGWIETLSKEIPFYLAWEEEQGYRGIYYNDCEGNLLEEDLPELEWKEDEESGEYYQVEDEYGEFWVDYFKEDMLKDNMNFSKEDLEKEDIEEERA